MSKSFSFRWKGRAIAAGGGAKVAVLSEDSDFGKDLEAGLRKGLGGKSGEIVASQKYEPTDAGRQVCA